MGRRLKILVADERVRLDVDRRRRNIFAAPIGWAHKHAARQAIESDERRRRLSHVANVQDDFAAPKRRGVIAERRTSLELA